MLGDLEHFESHQDFGYCRCIKFGVVKGAIAIRKMREGRVTGSR